MSDKIKIELTPKQYKYLTKYVLPEYEERVGRQICNDLEDELVDLFADEGEQIATEFAIMNNPMEPEGPNWPLPDFCLAYWLRKSIENQVKL